MTSAAKKQIADPIDRLGHQIQALNAAKKGIAASLDREPMSEDEAYQLLDIIIQAIDDTVAELAGKNKAL